MGFKDVFSTGKVLGTMVVEIVLVVWFVYTGVAEVVSDFGFTDDISAFSQLDLDTFNTTAVRAGTTPEAVRSGVSTECGWLIFFAVMSTLYLSCGVCAGCGVIVVSCGTRLDGNLDKAEEAKLKKAKSALRGVQFGFTLTGYLKLVIFGSMLNKFRWFGLWQGSEDLGTSLEFLKALVVFPGFNNLAEFLKAKILFSVVLYFRTIWMYMVQQTTDALLVQLAIALPVGLVTVFAILQPAGSMLVFHYVQREYIFDSNGDFDTNANLRVAIAMILLSVSIASLLVTLLSLVITFATSIVMAKCGILAQGLGRIDRERIAASVTAVFAQSMKPVMCCSLCCLLPMFIYIMVANAELDAITHSPESDWAFTLEWVATGANLALLAAAALYGWQAHKVHGGHRTRAVMPRVQMRHMG